MYVFKTVTRTLRWFVYRGDQDRTHVRCICERRNTGMYIVRQYSQNISKRVRDTYAWQCENGTKSVCDALCPYSRDLYGRELKSFLVIIPKVVISLLMVSRGIIPFEEHTAAVGTTSNHIFSKRKTLDEGSL